MKRTIALTITLMAACSVAAKTFDWPLDAPVAEAKIWTAYHGETVRFNLMFSGAMSNVTAEAIYYKTNGMDKADWFPPIPGTVFHPTNDCGAAEYRFFIKCSDPDGNNYTPNGTLRLLDSPGFTPNAIEPPVKTLDFATITILNPPWSDVSADLSSATNYTDSATNAALSAAVEYTDNQISPVQDSVSALNDRLDNAEANIDSAIQDALDLYILNTNASITVSNRVIRVIEHDGGTNIVRYTGVDIAAYSAATNALNEAIAALRALLATKIDSPANWADFAATGLTNGSDTVMLDRGSVTLTDGTVTWTPVGGYYFMTGSATASGNSSQFRIGTDADDWFGLEVSAAYLAKILPNSIQVSPTTVTLGTAFDPSYLTEAPHVYFTPSLGLDFEELESGVAWSQAGTNYVATVSGIADTYPSGFFRLKAMRSGGVIMRSTLPILPEGYRVEKSGAYVDTVQPDSVITVTVGGKSYKVIGEEVR
ncbi:MAG: hypothetical protein IKC15_02430 [Kiritimatiellae bacterium]|nr:hypothetical protein [Kiritimatiellia bacterium]